MSERRITIVHLYPKEMNIYGDLGNILTLQRRLEWHGFTPKVIAHHPGRPFPRNADIVVGGGGQDSGQSLIKKDLLDISEEIHKLVDDGVAILVICGLYQLFGRFFKTSRGETIKGIGVFKAETYGGPRRLVGNTIIESKKFGELIGYENHSGLTVLDNDQPALGRVIKGKGNNGEDTTEGAVQNNAYGSYLHGPLLPKNPILADELIRVAVTKRYGAFNPLETDDIFSAYAREVARRRPR